MKRWLIYGLVLAVVLLAAKEDHPGTDVARLDPVRILMLEESAGAVTVKTDLGHYGVGKTLAEAVEDMRQTASGEVFLDTAEFLLLSRGGAKWLPELSELLRPSCQVCLSLGITELEQAAEYLQFHKPGYSLRLYRKGEQNMPLLYQKEGKMYLAKS